MNNREFRLIETGTAAYEEMIALRMRVLLAPIGIPRTYIDTQKEKQDLLIGVYVEKRLVGCCILTERDKETVQLRQMAVDATCQKKGIGAALIAFAEGIALAKGYSTLVMHARDAVLPFYQKCGYAISGEQFFEVGIPHHKMQKRLSFTNTREP